MINVNLSQFLSMPVNQAMQSMITSVIKLEADEAYRMGEIPCRLEMVTFALNEAKGVLNIRLHPKELQDYIISY